MANLHKLWKKEYTENISSHFSRQNPAKVSRAIIEEKTRNKRSNFQPFVHIKSSSTLSRGIRAFQSVNSDRTGHRQKSTHIEAGLPAARRSGRHYRRGIPTLSHPPATWLPKNTIQVDQPSVRPAGTGTGHLLCSPGIPVTRNEQRDLTDQRWTGVTTREIVKLRECKRYLWFVENGVPLKYLGFDDLVTFLEETDLEWIAKGRMYFPFLYLA